MSRTCVGAAAGVLGLYDDARRAGVLVECAPRVVRAVVGAADGAAWRHRLAVALALDALRSTRLLIAQTLLAR